MPSTTNSDSSSVPATTTVAVDDTLQVPTEHNGNYSGNVLGTTTLSDVSSANSLAMLPDALAQPPDTTVEAFTLATSDTPVASGVNARGRIVPESLLLPIEDDDDEDEFIPRGNASGPSSVVKNLKPPHKPGKPHKPIKDGVNPKPEGK